MSQSRTADIPNSRSAISFAIDGHRRDLARMAGTAFLGGIAEAVFLVTVTRAAFAITDGESEVGIVGGWFLSVNYTLLLALGLVLTRVAMSGYATWQSAYLSTLVVANVRTRLVRAFLQSAWEVQQSQRSGSLQQLVSSYSGRTSGLIGGLSQGILAVANLSALLGLAVLVDPAGALAMVISVGLLGGLLRPIRGLIRRRARAEALAGMELAMGVSEASELGMELHVFHVQEQAQARLQKTIDDARDRTRALAFVGGSSSTMYTGLAYLALVAGLAAVSASATASLTGLGAVMLLMLRSLSYGQALQAAHANISGDAPVVDELQQILIHFENSRPPDGGEPVGNVGVIEADHVSFAYEQDLPVLSNITFSIEPCEIVGIVGPSGGGKSTLVQLLLGLRHPQAGRLLAAGRDIRTFDRAEWARRVTFVPQEAHLIAGTIADNIRFLREGVSDADVERAARLAHLHDEIVDSPDGYQRMLGAEGGRLSGGQQQRLCIARALVEHPDVIVLDEPTSALDVYSEHLVRSTLLGLKERMTVIVIAHRLSTLDICERLMVIQNGQLMGFDTPSNLEESSDFYREALRLSLLH